jgi:hypothetical protein
MFMLKASKVLLIMLAPVVAACTTTNVGSDGETRYRYSVFDFSGKSWAMQKQRCEALSMKPKHLDTECGLLLCTSRYGCETKAN